MRQQGHSHKRFEIPRVLKDILEYQEYLANCQL